MSTGRYGTAGRGTAGLVEDVMKGIASLVQGEIALARAEVRRSLRNAAAAVLALVIAAVLCALALATLARAATEAMIGLGLTPSWANVATAAVLLLLAIGMFRVAVGKLRPPTFAFLGRLCRQRRNGETPNLEVKRPAPAHARA
ncbi:MAG: phage holin family protein [Paracoccaceae bacterium]